MQILSYFDGSHNPENNSGGYGFAVFDIANKEVLVIKGGKLNREICDSFDCEKYALLELFKWIKDNIQKSESDSIIVRGDNESLIKIVQKYC